MLAVTFLYYRTVTRHAAHSVGWTFSVPEFQGRQPLAAIGYVAVHIGMGVPTYPLGSGSSRFSDIIVLRMWG